jgi:cyclophilin family peptidyl-prolyl cis-trans isomerase
MRSVLCYNFEVKKYREHYLIKRWMLLKMKKTGSILKFSLILCLAAVTLTACGKTKALTDTSSASAAPVQASAADLPCSKDLTALLKNNASGTPSEKSWTSPPKMSIDPAKTYCAVVQTNKGSITLQLFAKDAPKTVNNFVFLAKQNFYNGIIFHRIIQSFMIQTGDPLGTGMGDPGYKFEDELNGPYQYEPGIVAMANSGPNTNGSQFFICTGEDSKGLNNQPNYSIFARVASGMETVLKIAATPVKAGGENSSPAEKVMIENIQIVEL